MHRVLGAVYVAGLMTVGACLGSTQANAIPFDNSVDPNPNITVTTSSPYNYNHVIAGFNPATDIVTDADLNIVLSDDGGSEHIVYTFDGNIFNQNNTGNAAQTYSFDFGALNILGTLSDGVLNITLSATSGSYIFNFSRLTGNYTRTEQEVLEQSGGDVPEPATMLVMGVGLVGIGLSRFSKLRVTQ